MALHSKKQQKLWVWIAVSTIAGAVLAIEVGARGAKPLTRMMPRIMACRPCAIGTDAWKKPESVEQHLNQRCRPCAIGTDAWKVYRKVIPDNLLIQTKKVASRVDSTNSIVRGYLKRCHCKTKAYSKATHMVEASLYLLLYRQYIYRSEN